MKQLEFKKEIISLAFNILNDYADDSTELYYSPEHKQLSFIEDHYDDIQTLPYPEGIKELLGTLIPDEPQPIYIYTCRDNALIMFEDPNDALYNDTEDLYEQSDYDLSPNNPYSVFIAWD